VNRFFVDGTLVKSSSATILDEKDVHHCVKVLRLQPGEEVELCDGKGNEAIARIDSVSKQSVELTVLECQAVLRESPIEIVLFQALPKAQKMEVILQKCTEIGLAGFVPVQCERCVVRLSDESDSRKKIGRWSDIVEEAAKQSKRGIVPTLHMPIRIQHADQWMSEFDLILVPHTGDGTEPLKTVLENAEKPKRIAVWVGPEGGFTEAEALVLQELGGKRVTMGPRILRTETAGMALGAVLQYHWGDFGGIEK